jgi:cytoskeletal protein CcmA (bactofilin family)
MMARQFANRIEAPGNSSVRAESAAVQHGAASQISTGSVIDRDLKILGGGLLLVSEGNLTINGVVEGDVLGANVVIGQHGKVTGLVHGETVSILGEVSGTVRGVHVELKEGAHVDAEVHNTSISLDSGAHFEGRSRHYDDSNSLVPDLTRAIEERQVRTDRAPHQDEGEHQSASVPETAMSDLMQHTRRRAASMT